METTNEIRQATTADAQEICSIYNYYVLNTAITFETEPVSVEEMRSRIQEVLGSGLPYYVAVSDHHITGYCYLHQWNNRCAYSSTKEVSVYLDKIVRRQGIGTKLLKEILENINPENIHVLISGICLPNEGSVRKHPVGDMSLDIKPSPYPLIFRKCYPCLRHRSGVYTQCL